MHHDPDRSWITDPDPDHAKGTQPKICKICIASALLKVSGNLNLLMNLNLVLLIVLGFFNFHSPIDFIDFIDFMGGQ